MNTKVLIYIVLFVVLAITFYYIYHNKCSVQVWRRRFPEFPLRLFELSCGDINVSLDNGFDIVQIKNLFDTSSTYNCKLHITNETSNNPISSFIKIWMAGIVHSLPNDITKNKIPKYNFFISNKSSIDKHKEYVDNYFLVLSGKRRIIINQKEYILTKGDIIFVPKDTNREIHCDQNNDPQIMINIKME